MYKVREVIMEIRKFFMLCFSTALLIILLTGCVSQEARAVIEDIDALGEITLESLENIQAVYAKYDALTEEDKSAISRALKALEENGLVEVLSSKNSKYKNIYYEALKH